MTKTSGDFFDLGRHFFCSTWNNLGSRTGRFFSIKSGRKIWWSRQNYYISINPRILRRNIFRGKLAYGVMQPSPMGTPYGNPPHVIPLWSMPNTRPQSCT